MGFWQLELNVPNKDSDLIQGLLYQEAGFGWEEKEAADNRTLFEIYSEDRDLLDRIARQVKGIDQEAGICISAAEKKDWQSAWREFFTPVEAGTRFVILPPWLAHLEHSRRQEIIIEPRNAFGTGHHASTVLCLEALSQLLDAKRLGRTDWFLDLGCGSGILAIAAEKAGMSGTALDIDPVAIANARENRELNEADDVEILLGGIEKIGRTKYDLVMANILAQPLIDMAAKIAGAMKAKGCLILGGILASQAQEVANAYMAQGLGKPRELQQGEWVALVWE